MEINSARKGRRRPTRDEGPAVTREQIIDTAYRIARTEHLDAIQIRRVARELGVWPQAIYYHVPSKNELLQEVANRALATRRPPSRPPATSWEDRLLDLFHRVTEVFQAHPGLAEFSVTRPNFGWSEQVATIAEEALALLFEGGLTPAEAIRAFASLAALIAGEAQLERAAGAHPDAVPWPVDKDRFPATAELTTATESERGSWPTGVETFIAGLSATHRERNRREDPSLDG